MDQAARHPLSGINIESDSHSLLVVPARYQDKRVAHRTVADIPLGAEVIHQAMVKSAGMMSKNEKRPFLQIVLRYFCGTEAIARVFSTAEYGPLLKQFKSDKEAGISTPLTFLGTLQRFGRVFVIQSLAIAEATGSVEPVYPGYAKASGKLIFSAVRRALVSDVDLEAAADVLRACPDLKHAIRRHGFRTARDFFSALHKPSSIEEGCSAILAAKSASVAQVRGAVTLSARRQEPAKWTIESHLRMLVPSQPEQLSQGQRKALHTIANAFQFSNARVLLEGDVGSGKTLVFLLVAAASMKASGLGCAIVAPNEIVARQIYLEAGRRFPEIAAAWVGANSKGNIANAQLIVGTQAVLNVRADLPPLCLLIVDEQQKFSVEQRSRLVAEHVIEATATPLPRTLALGLFAAWTRAVIKGAPVAKTIHSSLHDGNSRHQVLSLVRNTLAEGRRAVFVYPSVKQGSTQGVEDAARRIEEKFPGKVVSLFGSSKNNVENLKRFSTGECPIAVATTVLEVGVDVADIGCMVVNGADRFGISQLHQLRGRLVRNGGTGYFAMYVQSLDKLAGTTRSRLDAVVKHADGFELADADMRLRGFGDLLGEMQSGASVTTLKVKLGVEDFLDEAQPLLVA